MRPILWGITLVLCSAGCTAYRLQTSIVNQAGTLSEVQYQQVLGNLAMFQGNPDALPAHVAMRDGSAQVSDLGSASILLDIHRAITSHPSLTGTRTVVEQWGVNPVTDDTGLKLVQLAYQRASGRDVDLGNDFANDLAHELKNQISGQDDLDLRNQSQVPLSPDAEELKRIGEEINKLRPRPGGLGSIHPGTSDAEELRKIGEGIKRLKRESGQGGAGPGGAQPRTPDADELKGIGAAADRLKRESGRDGAGPGGAQTHPSDAEELRKIRESLDNLKAPPGSVDADTLREIETDMLKVPIQPGTPDANELQKIGERIAVLKEQSLQAQNGSFARAYYNSINNNAIITTNDEYIIEPSEPLTMLDISISTSGRVASPSTKEVRRLVKGVEKDLTEIRAGWFHVGRWKDVPHDACYVGRYGDCYAWVFPDGLRDLTEFTLKILAFSTLIRERQVVTSPGGGPRYSPAFSQSPVIGR